jgi:hypothetical protein
MSEEIYIPKSFMIITISSIILITIIVNVVYSLDLYQQLSKNLIAKAVRERYKCDIIRISLVKGDMAGDIGFYFVELETGQYSIIPDDARLYPWYLEGRSWKMDNPRTKITFLDYFFEFQATEKYPCFQKTIKLQFNSLIDIFLKRKNENQIIWEKYQN